MTSRTHVVSGFLPARRFHLASSAGVSRKAMMQVEALLARGGLPMRLPVALLLAMVKDTSVIRAARR
jgi:hypothetical protein